MKRFIFCARLNHIKLIKCIFDVSFGFYGDVMGSSKFDALKIDGQLCFPLYACSREIIKLYKPFLDKLDLTYTQYIVMMILWEKESVTVKELGALLYLDSGTLTPVLKKMEHKGLIIRRRSSQDERILIVSLTEEGRNMREDAVEIPYEMKKICKLNEEEAKNLYSILTKMLKSF